MVFFTFSKVLRIDFWCSKMASIEVKVTCLFRTIPGTSFCRNMNLRKRKPKSSRMHYLVEYFKLLLVCCT